MVEEPTFDESINAIPNSRILGYNYTLVDTNKNFAFSATANGDVGLSYELPLYTMNQYYVSRQRVSAFIGGRQTVSFLLYLFRINFYIDIWPVKATFENYFANDYLVNRENCAAGFFYFDSFRIQILYQLDYCDIGAGILGLVFANISGLNIDNKDYCTWQTYFLNKPLVDWAIFYDGLEKELYRTKNCGTRVIERYDTTT